MPPRPSSTSPSPEQARQIAEARLALEASMNNIGASLDNTLKSRAANLHSNSTALSKQQDALTKETANLKRENDRLGRVANDMSKQLKELGNVQNWAEMLERDFMVVEETLRRVREGSAGSGGSWSGSGSGSGSYWSGSEDGEGSGERVEGKGGVEGGVGDGDVEMGGMDGVHPSNTVNGNKGKEIARAKDQTNGSSAPGIAATAPEPNSVTPIT